MKLRIVALLFAVLALARVSAGWIEARNASRAELAAAAAAAAQEPAGPSLSRAEFASLVARISETGGYFDTDNLVSNESSYLHVMGKLEELGIRGGAYIGVGPDQNFSYIARTRPDIAFIIDIRRDNLLQHLWFKALFERAPTRIEFLSLMLGRRPPPEPARWTASPIDRLVDEVSRQPSERATLEEARRQVLETVNDFGLRLSIDDLATIGRIHARFAEAGFALRFTTHGRAPRSFYPTFGSLLLETDREGRRASYLASEEDYRFVRDLERRNLVLPVVGDLAGPKALAEIGNVLRERRMDVSTFYLSNVEFYLMQDGTFDRFARNTAALPASDGVLIRSLFGSFYAHPQNVPGYYSTQLMQTMRAFVSGFEAGRFRTYDDLLYGDLVETRKVGGEIAGGAGSG